MILYSGGRHHIVMNTDLSKLALALEYVDMAAGHYIAGGSDHAAQLLAAAAEKLLADLGRMLGSQRHEEEVQQLLHHVAGAYASPRDIPQPHNKALDQQGALSKAHELGALPDNSARQATVALLRACWYLLESLGLEAAMPERLVRAIELSTVVAQTT